MTMLQYICLFQHKSHLLYKSIGKNFPGGPVVENPPGHAGGGGLIPSQGTKILYDALPLISARWVPDTM